MVGRPVLLLITGLPGTGKSTLAERVAPTLGAPVLGWDWTMAALTPFDGVQSAIAEMDRFGHRCVGWSLMWQTAGAQLRRGMSVVLDGVARDHEIAGTRVVAQAHDADALVVLTTCDDETEHRSRIEGRDRAIPGWHELTWDEVRRTQARWQPPRDVDLVVDTHDDLDHALDLTTTLVASIGRTGRSL
jgi:predicted kinase